MKRLALLLLLLCATPAHATVNEVFARNDYVGNTSTTSFPYTFRIINQADVLVLLNGVLQTLNVNYTVVGVDNPGGGAVIFTVAPPTAVRVTLLRSQRFQQLSIYTPNEAFPAKRIESDLDKNAMVDQRQQEEIGRALKFDPHSLFRNVFVDDPIAGKCLSWNSSLTRVVAADCSGGGGPGPGGVITGSGDAGQVTFWTSITNIAGDGKFLWDNSAKALTVGTTPLGPLKSGNAFMGLQGPSNATGMQNLMLQTVQGDPSLIGLVTLGDDRVGISSWNFRGTGATNPIYGANFGVVFNTNGVANGLEIDVQNDSATNYQGQALWLNGSTRSSSSAGHRANAILIDTQDGSKWERGILFKEGFIGGGATGSIEKMGIHFEQSQDADFIVIQPRLGTLGNVAVKLTNPEFTTNRFELLNSGAIRVGNTLTGPAFPSYAFVEEQTTGIYMEAPSVLGFSLSGPLVPGPGTAGFRRMTLGTVAGPPAGPAALNLWPWGTGANQGGTINLFDPTSVHSVGFLAPDFIGNSFRVRLPNAPGFAGQCVITSGGFPIETWSYAACGSGGGGGSGTVTNTGVLGLNQVILGDGGVAIKGLGSLGTATTVLHGNAAGAPVFGPVIVADIGATGTPNATTFLRGDGTWSVPGGSGTVTTSGSPLVNQVALMSAATVITGSPNFTFSGANVLTVTGLANINGTMNVTPAVDVANAIFSEVKTSLATGPFYPLLLRAASTIQMTDGFGPAFAMAASDADAINRNVMQILTERKGNDLTYTLQLQTAIAGVLGTRLFINELGQVFYTPTPATGTFGLLANGTRRTELQFYTDNLTNTVALIAPETATGNHVWKLPSTFGAAGSVLTNDGAGQLSWAGAGTAAVTTTGTPAVNQFAFMTGPTTISSHPGFSFDPIGEYIFMKSLQLRLEAVSTRKMSLWLFGNNNTSGVSFIAPATATGFHTWVLPTTLGAAGSVLANDGAGNLSWAATGTAVTTTGSPGANQFTFMSGTNTITSSPSFSFNAGSGVVSLSGAGTLQIGSVPTVARTLNVTSGSPPARFERSDASTTVGTGTAVQMVHTTSAQMTPNFDVLQTFVLRDADGVDNIAAILRGFRGAGGVDTDLGFSISAGGSQITLDGLGQFLFTPTPTVGSFVLQANGTRVTEFKISTENNANTVGFTAPATATGNHMWRLPSSFGAANSIMFHDGAGNMGWATGLNTTATVRNAAGSGTCALTFVSGVLTSSSC